MAEVFRAETAPVAGISRTVAIKRMLAAHMRGGDSQVLDETRIWVKLQHPNIVSVLDFGELDDDWFLALELVEGVTASDLVKHHGALPIEEALTIGERVARALHYAHTLEEDGTPLEIVHRDVKLANILVSIRGEVKLTDFGIARAANRTARTMTGVLKGSLTTITPEQVREEKLDARSDLFALGATLHHLLIGKPLLDLPLERLVVALDAGEIPRPPAHLPPRVRLLLQALTNPDRERRPGSAADVAKAIRLILQPSTPDDVEPLIGKRVAEVRAARAPRFETAPPPTPHAQTKDEVTSQTLAARLPKGDDLDERDSGLGKALADDRVKTALTPSPPPEAAAVLPAFPEDSATVRSAARNAPAAAEHDAPSAAPLRAPDRPSRPSQPRRVVPTAPSRPASAKSVRPSGLMELPPRAGRRPWVALAIVAIAAVLIAMFALPALLGSPGAAP